MDQRQQQIKKSFTDKAVHTPKHSNALVNFICSKQLLLICGKENAYASGNGQFHTLGYNTAFAFINQQKTRLLFVCQDNRFAFAQVQTSRPLQKGI